MKYSPFFLALLALPILPMSSFRSPEETDSPKGETGAVNSLQLIRDDMNLPHEGVPRGLPPTTDWAAGPRIGWGNNPPNDWNAMIPWGQIYADSRGNPAVNVRCQIRNMQAWYLSKKDDQWKKWVLTSRIDGANYAEDFQNDVNIPADIRQEGPGAGISVPPPSQGYNFHFWSEEGRIVMDPLDIAGVWVSIEARLIAANENLPDDRDAARLLFSAGADYWQSPTAAWDQWKTNGDIGIGRFRYLTSKWQAFNMHTLSEAQLQSNPPPYK